MRLEEPGYFLKCEDCNKTFLFNTKHFKNNKTHKSVRVYSKNW